MYFVPYRDPYEWFFKGRSLSCAVPPSLPHSPIALTPSLSLSLLRKALPTKKFADSSVQSETVQCLAQFDLLRRKKKKKKKPKVVSSCDPCCYLSFRKKNSSTESPGLPVKKSPIFFEAELRVYDRKRYFLHFEVLLRK